VPIILLTAWVFQPRIAEKATSHGFLGADTEPGAVSADD
jgi:hypothetical protein